MQRKYLRKADQKRIGAFFKVYDKHLFGIRAKNKVAERYAIKFGIGALLEGHSLARLARKHCKWWRVVDENFGVARWRSNFTRAEWVRMADTLSGFTEELLDGATLPFIYRRMHKLVPCTRASVKETIKFLNMRIPDEPEPNK